LTVINTHPTITINGVEIDNYVKNNILFYCLLDLVTGYALPNHNAEIFRDDMPMHQRKQS